MAGNLRDDDQLAEGVQVQKRGGVGDVEGLDLGPSASE